MLSSALNFDSRPCRESTLKDLNLSLFAAYRVAAVDPEIIANNHRTMEEQLASLRFFDLKYHCPTMAGILLFGNNPRYFLPGAYLQYLKLPGIELTDLPENQAEISGDLLSILRELDTHVRVNIQKTLHPLTALREKVLSDYPERAVRELLMNAVMHRNYESNTPARFYWFSDRIEILSPGGLYGEVTPDNYLTRNSYRNPVIAAAMKLLGYVNQFGYGIQNAQRLLQQNGNPPATFDFDARSVLVRIPKRSE